MKYYARLGLAKEPFSNSPDPEMFYSSLQHQSCLQKLELAVRLKRGLSVVIGDVGTGKSTLCRQLLRTLGDEGGAVSAHLILDPEFTSAQEFLMTICATFGISDTDQTSEWRMKESIKNYLFQQGVDLSKTPTLIIDEGQKLPEFCVEILREFLNYETNRYKLLQIVIFAQEEFKAVIKSKANFADRITTYHHLKPLSFSETRRMIDFRLRQSMSPDRGRQPKFFTSISLIMVHLLTGGSPRKIVMLCSKIILGLLIKNKKVVDPLLVLSCAKETSIPMGPGILKGALLFTIPLLLVAAGLTLWPGAPATPPIPPPQGAEQAETKAVVAPTVEEAPKEEAQALEEKESGSPPDVELPRLHGEEQPAKPAGLPELLGQLPIERDTSLSKMVARVYGRFYVKWMHLILEANPQIANPNHLLVGDMITFPALEEAVPQTADRTFLELRQTDSIKEAYAFIKEYGEKKPDLIMLHLWKKDMGVRFAVVLQEYFPDQNEAHAALAALPADLHKNGKVTEYEGWTAF